MTLLQQIDRATHWVSRAFLVVGGLALLLMAAHVTGDVVGRIGFSRPFYGTTEIVSFYYMVAAVCLPLAYIELRDEHITVDALYLQMPDLLRKVVFVFACLVTAGFFGLFAYQSWHDSLRAMAARDMVMGAAMIEIWPSRFCMPVGFALLAVAAALRAAKALLADELPAEQQHELEVD